jgi:hypothetical protein
MKFNATVVFEFNAHDVAEAGAGLNALLEQASEASLATKSIELATPLGTPVMLPQVTPSGGGDGGGAPAGTVAHALCPGGNARTRAASSAWLPARPVRDPVSARATLDRGREAAG